MPADFICNKRTAHSYYLLTLCIAIMTCLLTKIFHSTADCSIQDNYYISQLFKKSASLCRLANLRVVSCFSYISGVTILGTPAEIYRFGTQYCIIAVAIWISGIVVATIYLPVFCKLEVYSSYEVKPHDELAPLLKPTLRLLVSGTTVQQNSEDGGFCPVSDGRGKLQRLFHVTFYLTTVSQFFRLCSCRSWCTFLPWHLIKVSRSAVEYLIIRRLAFSHRNRPSFNRNRRLLGLHFLHGAREYTCNNPTSKT